MLYVIGSYDEKTGKIQRAASEQGYVYKNDIAYQTGKGICYVPELIDTQYTRKDFAEIALYNRNLANFLYYEVDWQSPETLLEELTDSTYDYDYEYYWLLSCDLESYTWNLQTLSGDMIASVCYIEKRWKIHVTVNDVDAWFDSKFSKLSEIREEAIKYLSKFTNIDHLRFLS